MINEKHLALLKQGIEVWNEWRLNNPEIKPELCGADFSNLNLRGIDFSQTDLGIVNLSGADLSNANLSGVNFRQANLTRADLTGADLSGAFLALTNLTQANLSNAVLYKANLKEAILNKCNLDRANLTEAILVSAQMWESSLIMASLNQANLTGAYLTKADFTDAQLVESLLVATLLGEADLSGANLSKADLWKASLSKATLTNTNLAKANLAEVDLRECNLCNANLTQANLSTALVMGSTFEQATLTGACIQDWNINSTTQLDGVICDYVYLQQRGQERRPSSGSFASGEFTKLFQKAVETVDLIFRNGIDWQAFLNSFQKLQVKCDSEELSIQALENKNDGAFVIRVNVPFNANKAEIEKYLKQEYELQLRLLEEKYIYQLEAKDEQIAIHRQQNANLTEIVKILANKPITVEAKAVVKSSNYDLQYSQIAGGIVDAETVHSQQIGGNIDNADR